MYKKIVKGCLSSGVQGVGFACIKSRIKKNLKRVAWGLDVGQEDRTRIKSLIFVFVFFEIYFLSCKLFYLTLIIFI